MADQIADFEKTNFLMMKKNFILSKMPQMIDVQDDGDNIRFKRQDINEEDDDY